MRFRVDVDGKKVSRRIEKRINKGIKDASEDISRGIERRAKGHIRREGAIWRHRLIEGFEDATLEFGDRTIVSVRNVSGHAPAQEYGVSGTEVKRDTPLSYKNKKPPVTALIPWVRAHLVGTGFDPYNRYGDSGDGSSGSDSGGSGGDGGSSGGGSSVDDTDDSITTDSNGLYVPGTNFQEFDVNDEFGMRSTYPGQRVVVLDRLDKKYRRATVVKYPDADDEKVEVKFEDDGGITTLTRYNSGDFRLAGGEFWDSLTASEQKALLKDHFDAEIRDGHKDHSGLKNNPDMGLEAPTSDRADWVRDTWLSDVWENYDDKWYVKEQFRNMVAQFGTATSRAKKGAIGGIGPMNGNNRFISVFLSKNQLSKYTSVSESDYVGTLLHESLHALSASQALGHPGGTKSHTDILKHADWERDGNQLNSDPLLELPDDAKLQMFHDDTTNTGDPVGGTGWIGDAYDAAMNGEKGVESYSPTLTETDPLLRLHEAANHAFWLQSVAARERHKNEGGIDSEDPLFVNWAYSIANAEETLATFHEVMTSETDDIEERLKYIDRLYPWLINEWLGFFTSSEQAKLILEDLGYTV